MAPVSASTSICAPGEAVEIHRGAEFAGKGEQRRQRARRLVVAELGALGARHRDRFVENGAAQLLHVRAPQHRLPLQRERGDRIGDGVDQKLAPRERGEVVAQQHAQRRAVEQRGESAPGRVVGHRDVLTAPCRSRTRSGASRSPL